MTSEPIAPDVWKTLVGITTATLTTVLLKKGLRNTWIRRAAPLRSGGGRLAGPAFTLRFVPYREDLASPASWSSPISTRAAIEAMPAGAMVIADAMGSTDAGIFGDILCARMVKRGVNGLITDGVMRDLSGVLGTGLPVWAAGAAAPPSVAALHFVGWEETIACGGVCIVPGDAVVADDDGAVVIPRSIVEEVASQGAEQEAQEEWIMSEVEAGASLPGLYPPNAENLSRYEASKKKK
ncbi:MAG: ribonuclease activity regulator RraA [Rhodospirillales bacterium]|jgi:regulator of RNase E activity RraA